MSQDPWTVRLTAAMHTPARHAPCRRATLRREPPLAQAAGRRMLRGPRRKPWTCHPGRICSGRRVLRGPRRKLRHATLLGRGHRHATMSRHALLGFALAQVWEASAQYRVRRPAVSLPLSSRVGCNPAGPPPVGPPVGPRLILRVLGSGGYKCASRDTCATSDTQEYVDRLDINCKWQQFLKQALTSLTSLQTQVLK